MISLKHLYKNKVTLGLLCAAFFTLHSSLFTSCSDQFLEDKRPYGSFGPDEVYNDLSMQLHTYLHHFHNEVFTIRFQTTDGQLLDVTNRLNAEQRIEGFTHEDDTF